MDGLRLDGWTILVLHAAATYSLLGLIWVVQWVHYPSFVRANRAEFQSFAKFHVDRISLLVVPLMFLEMVTGVLLCLFALDGVERFWFVLGLGCIAVIWLVTVLVSAPLHWKLLRGYHDLSVLRLIRWNWVRTGFWTLRALGLTWVLLHCRP